MNHEELVIKRLFEAIIEGQTLSGLLQIWINDDGDCYVDHHFDDGISNPKRITSASKLIEAVHDLGTEKGREDYKAGLRDMLGVRR